MACTLVFTGIYNIQFKLDRHAFPGTNSAECPKSPHMSGSSLGDDSLETMEGLLPARRLSPEKEES